jgi:hypothetical protein
VFTSDNDFRVVYVRECNWRRVCPFVDHKLTLEYEPVKDSVFGSAASRPGSSVMIEITVVKKEHAVKKTKKTPKRRRLRRRQTLTWLSS